MKKVIGFLLSASGAIAWLGLLIALCSPDGDSPNEKIKGLDRLKNRTGSPTVIWQNAPLKELLAATENAEFLSQYDGASVSGYVVLVKDGGPETANCHAKDELQKDTHIELAASSGETDPGKTMIVEITPAFKKLHPDWITTNLRKQLLGKHVTFSGFLFADVEHKQFALASSPGATDVERATVIEIHPTVSFAIEK